MSVSGQLAADLDSAAAPGLAAMLRRLIDAGTPLVLDGAQVARLGQACLQVLLSAQAACQARQLRFAIVAPSDPLRTMADTVGANQLLSESEA